MKLSILIVVILQLNIMSFGQTRYFDENNNSISKSKYIKKVKSRDYLPIPGDSVNNKKLIKREQSGQINNRSMLISYFKQELQLALDTSKILVIIFYPGKDACNSSGTMDKNVIKNWYTEMEVELYKLTAAKPIYLYKDQSGLEKFEGIINWYKDPDSIVENIFFKHHYPCESFVVISKKGEYISYLGEFPKEYIWKTANKLNKN